MIAQPPLLPVVSEAAGPGCQLLDACDMAEVLDGFRSMLPVPEHTEEHLRGVLLNTLARPGSLVRAQLAYGLMRGQEVAPERALSVAVALEYFHTASLLFDDLPCMDDGTERRGWTCAHILFGEAAATLGALAFITQGYALCWDVIGEIPAPLRTEAGRLMRDCLGHRGILEGQARDLHFRRAVDHPLQVAEGKTATLVRLTLLLPATVAGLDAGVRDALAKLAQRWGLGYQIVDDFKDLLMTPQETGKTTAMDGARARPNYAATVGYTRAGHDLLALLADARAILHHLPLAPSAVRCLLALQHRLESAAEELGRRAAVAAA